MKVGAIGAPTEHRRNADGAPTQRQARTRSCETPSRMNETPVLLTPQRLAPRLGVPAEWLWREAAAGRLPHIRAGWRIYFDPHAVARILRERAAAMPAADAKEVKP